MMDSLVLVVSSRESSSGPADPGGGDDRRGTGRLTEGGFGRLQSRAIRGRFVAEHFPAYLDPGGVARLSERLSPEGIRRQIRRNREELLSPLASPLDAEWISGDPLNLREIVRESLLRRTVTKGIDLSTGYYMDADRTVALLMVRPSGSSRDTAFVAGLYREVAGIAAKVSDGSGTDAGIKVGLAGGVCERGGGGRRDLAGHGLFLPLLLRPGPAARLRGVSSPRGRAVRFRPDAVRRPLLDAPVRLPAVRGPEHRHEHRRRDADRIVRRLHDPHVSSLRQGNPGGEVPRFRRWRPPSPKRGRRSSAVPRPVASPSSPWS